MNWLLHDLLFSLTRLRFQSTRSIRLPVTHEFDGMDLITYEGCRRHFAMYDVPIFIGSRRATPCQIPNFRKLWKEITDASE